MLSRKLDNVPLKIDSTVIGIGNKENYFVYKCNDCKNYLIYSVGENGIDEHGKGDDIVKKDNTIIVHILNFILN